MRRWRRYTFCLLLALGILVLCMGGRSRTRTASHSDPVTFQQRVVAVGDLHGDLVNTQAVLKMAGVVNEHRMWAGGRTTLVQIGDIADRGPDALHIYLLMARLRSQAAEAGGRVVSLLGNHEMMNAFGDWQDVPSQDLESFGGPEARRRALSAEGWLGKEWLANYTMAVKIQLGPESLGAALGFTHASLRPNYPLLTPFPDAINSAGRQLLAQALRDQAPPSLSHEGAPSTQQRPYDSRGPLLSRAFADGPEASVCRWAEETRNKIGVRRLINGHTPRLDRIVDRCNASVIIIDTGISSAFGGVLSALEINYSLTSTQEKKSSRVASSSEVPPGQYTENEVVCAIYPGRREEISREERTVEV